MSLQWALMSLMEMSMSVFKRSRCCKWINRSGWQEVTARSCQKSWRLVGVEGGCLKLLEQGLPWYSCGGISIPSLRLIWVRSVPKPSKLFSPFLEKNDTDLELALKASLWGLSRGYCHRLWCLWRRLDHFLSNIFCRPSRPSSLHGPDPISR